MDKYCNYRAKNSDPKYSYYYIAGPHWQAIVIVWSYFIDQRIKRE